ncbi:glycine betaine ABC transporter substrate-binding protein [Veronia pacifica]|uniref:ABC-type glycine betaine transport system substrate-binding domain-containing protein n=2 Tax=Veronia pacifica TaxID=1080227 RepID=A0A1C3EM87_9GAMM|nr:hypothetical protein A8L45_06360 [Veronia pacifica]
MIISNTIPDLFFYIRRAFFSGVFTISLLMSLPTSALEQKIKLLKLDWASQNALTHITEILLNKAGVSTEIVEADSLGQWFFLYSGRADVQMEVWAHDHSPLKRLLSEGYIIKAGDHLAEGRKEWWYPEHVKEMCPGLPDWRALNECYRIFAPEAEEPTAVGSEALGRFFSGPWNENIEARIRALELKYHTEYVNDEGELWSLLDNAVTENKPIILLNWTPNWVDRIYPGEFVEFPKHQQDCETQPNWGLNRLHIFDCGYPSETKIVKVAVDGLPICVIKIINSISLTEADMVFLSSLIKLDINYRYTARETAEIWIKQNKRRWDTWLSGVSCAPTENDAFNTI